MKHLRRYNESAGRPWLELRKGEMRRHMNGKEADTFAKGEVTAILDLMGATGRHVIVTEYLIGAKTLEVGLFNRSARRLREHVFGGGTDGAAPSVHIVSPMTPANNICISDQSRHIWTEIFKSTDDYFYVTRHNLQHQGSALSGPGLGRNECFYLCDELHGLKSMLGDFFEGRKQ